LILEHGGGSVLYLAIQDGKYQLNIVNETIEKILMLGAPAADLAIG